MRHASLFTGIGGFDLAAEWMGWENIFQCEIDAWCQKLLKQNFPTVQHRYGNVKETDFKQWAGFIDILTGGFPCQPYSTAGKRLGKEDERHLWPEYLRAIREIRPRWVVGENVRGLTNWNGGVVFDEVQADLEAEDYEVLPFLLPAAGVNAPHRRDRIWIVAHSNGEPREPGIERGREMQRQKREQVWGIAAPVSETWATSYSKVFTQRKQTDETNAFAVGRETWAEPCSFGRGGIVANASSVRFQDGFQSRQPCIPCSPGMQQRSESARTYPAGDWSEFPTQSPVCGRDDGIPYRVHRLKGLGNAVVPQGVLQIFKAIEQYELLRIPA